MANQPRLPLAPRLVRVRETRGYRNAADVEIMNLHARLARKEAESAALLAECERLREVVGMMLGAEPGWPVSRAMVAR